MRRIGFTLLELLAVIGIITLLAAVLIPALQGSRRQARTVLCSSNIKQLLLGLSLYETENQTLPAACDWTPMRPPPGGYPGYGQYDTMGWWWFNYMEGFFSKADNKKTVLLCPSKKLNNPKLRNNILCGNYGVNRSLCKSPDDIQIKRAEFVGLPVSTTYIPRPAQTLLVVDCGYSMITWWHAADRPPYDFGDMIEDTAYIPGLKINKTRNLWPGQENDAINGRHPNKTVNVGFADGHVSRKKADDLLVEKTGSDGYKNLHPLWQPK